MRRERILAVIMSVLLALSMIPVTVSAAEPPLDGKLKIQGTAAESRTLSADFKEVKPEGITEDDVTYLWQRKTVEDEAAEKAGEKPELKELGKEKTYVVTQDDIGSKIVLTITGKEENGYSGSLKVVSDEVVDAQTAAELEAAAAAQQEESQAAEQPTEETAEDTTQAEQPADQEIPEAEADNTDNAETQETAQDTDNTQNAESVQETETAPAQEEVQTPAGSETVDGIPEATTDEEKQQEETAGSESVEGIPAATEDGTYGTETSADTENTQDTGAAESQVTVEASIIVGDGSTDTVDFGTVTAGQEDTVQAQYVTISNTGNTTLNFPEISPEHFMVQDITDPMEPNSSQQLWVVPRPGVEAGTYEDTVTYTSDEGAVLSFKAKMTVQAAESDNTDTDQNKDAENTDNAGDANNGSNGDDGNNGETPQQPTLTADQTQLTFTTNDRQKITVINSGSTSVRVTATATGETPVVTVDPSTETEIPAGESKEFAVTPVENLTVGTEYSGNILFQDKADQNNSISIPVTVTLPVPATSNVSADNQTPDFGKVVQGYTEAPVAKTITLTNNGDAEADLSDAVPVENAAELFDVQWSAGKLAANGGSASLTIRPKTGLTANATPYSGTFKITDNTNNSTIVITATMTVEGQDHVLTPSASNLDFVTTKKGYSEVAAQQITITNNGNVTETLTQPTATNFNISVADPAQLTLVPGASVTFSVQPKTGLDVGAYQETIDVASGNIKASFTVSFQVIKNTASLTKIQQPSAVSGLANGTKKDSSSLKLPTTVVIETTGGNMKASVTWNVKGASYKQSSTDAQKFTVAGTVTLPNGVDNDSNLSLAVSVEVSVKAYSPKLASAENNKITGIDSNGVYTTQSKISFTAVGAGMDNNSPKKGDTRYVPQSWTVINTNGWSAAPYTASFGLAKSGDYTLKVVFKQQQYNGSEWADTDTTDTRQVAFSITKAEVTAPGTNLTPAANQKNAVKTGDNTPILPFVCILIIAAGAIGGVVFYKKKNRK